MIDRSLNVWSVADIQLFTSQIPAEHTFLPQQRKLEETRRQCSQSGQSSRARRRAARNNSRHQSAEEDETQQVDSKLVTNNVEAEIVSNKIEDQTMQVELKIDNPELLVNDESIDDMNVEEKELVNCRNLNKELQIRSKHISLRSGRT